jgi:hypothetical protein
VEYRSEVDGIGLVGRSEARRDETFGKDFM